MVNDPEGFQCLKVQVQSKLGGVGRGMKQKQRKLLKNTLDIIEDKMKKQE